MGGDSEYKRSCSRRAIVLIVWLGLVCTQTESVHSSRGSGKEGAVLSDNAIIAMTAGLIMRLILFLYGPLQRRYMFS